MGKGITNYIFTVENTLLEVQTFLLLPSIEHLLKCITTKGGQVFLYAPRNKIQVHSKLKELKIDGYISEVFDKPQLQKFLLSHTQDSVMVTSSDAALEIAKYSKVLTCAIDGGTGTRRFTVVSDITFHAASELEKYIETLLKGNLSFVKALALKGAVPIVQEATIDFIAKLISERGVKRILEIGSAIGYSAIQMAKCPGVEKVITIERDTQKAFLANENIKRESLSDKITLINADALTYELKCEGVAEKFDLIFIDCAKSQYKKAFEHYSPFLREGGVIISDNLLFHGMVEDITLTKNRDTRRLVKKICAYRTFLSENKDWETQFFETGDGISLTTKRKNT